ncbi:MAG: phospholipase [Acidimicrobiia bacterium]|nr:phospholipase [Acidimicrobiia bacterium]
MTELRVNVVGSAGAGPASRLLVLIHGYGADEHDLAPLASLVDPGGDFFTICPRGPYDVAPHGGAAWYERGPDAEIDPSSFQGALVALDHLVDAFCGARRFDRSETVVVGFSQGAAMALALALRASGKARPSRVAALSGTLQQPEWLVYDWAAADLPPVFVQHGTEDPVVDVERGRRTRSELERHGLAVTYREYPMAHEITRESIADLAEWLTTSRGPSG